MFLQWREASFTNPDGEVLRVYSACSVADSSVDNWLRTPFVARHDANRIYVEVKFTMRKCTKFPNPDRLQQCKESFKLLYREEAADTDRDPTYPASSDAGWDDDTYRHIDVVAANKVFESVNETEINTETRSVPVAGGRGGGIYFAFRDQGACTTLIAVRVYYIICPSTVANLAVFPDTSTGPEMTAVVQRTGVCVENAVVEHVPSFLCKGDGSWYFPTGNCRCAAGHEPREQQQRCVGE